MRVSTPLAFEQELRAAGRSAAELRRAGVAVAELRPFGLEMLKSIVSARELRTERFRKIGLVSTGDWWAGKEEAMESCGYATAITENRRFKISGDAKDYCLHSNDFECTGLALASSSTSYWHLVSR